MVDAAMELARETAQLWFNKGTPRGDLENDIANAIREAEARGYKRGIESKRQTPSQLGVDEVPAMFPSAQERIDSYAGAFNYAEIMEQCWRDGFVTNIRADRMLKTLREPGLDLLSHLAATETTRLVAGAFLQAAADWLEREVK